MKIRDKLLEYMRLMRFHSVSSETTIILLGALIMGQRNLFLLFIVFIIGVFGHIFGYVLNDYADLEVDKKSDELKKKPLVSGIIIKSHAFVLAISAGIFAFFLTFIFFPNIVSILILICTAIVSITYDFYGKKIPYVSDFLVGAALFLFCLFGASTASIQFTNIIFFVCVIFFFDTVYINGVEGGVKDVDHDFLAGAKTLATLMGVKVINNKLIFTKKFVIFSYIIRAIYIFLIFLLGIVIDLWNSDQYIMQSIIIILIILMVIVNYRFLHISNFDRSKIKKLIAVHSALSGIIIMLILLPVLGPFYVLFLLLFPVTWYTVFNYILYGKPLQPRI